MKSFLFDDDDEIFLALGLVLSMIIVYNNGRKKYNLTRSAICEPCSSPWEKLYKFGDCQSF